MYQLVLHKLLIYKGFLDFKKEKTAEGLPLPLIVLPIKRPVLQRFRAGDLPALGLGLRLRAGDVAGAVLLDVVVGDQILARVDQVVDELVDQRAFVLLAGALQFVDLLLDPGRHLGDFRGSELHRRDNGADGGRVLELAVRGQAGCGNRRNLRQLTPP